MADTAALILPKVRTASIGQAVGSATASMVIPAIDVASSALPGQTGSAAAALPSLVITAVGGAKGAATLTKLTTSASGIFSLTASASATLRKPTSASTGYPATSGAGVPRLTRVTLNGYVATGTVGTASAVLTRPLTSGVGWPYLSASAHPTLTSPELNAIGMAVATATVQVRLPAIKLSARQLVGSTTFALAQVTNTATSSVTLFDAYNFNSMCTFAGMHLGASSSGLAKLDDTASTELPLATMALGRLSFGSELQKRCDNFYIAMRATSPITLRVATDENDPYEYEIEPLSVDTLKQRRSLIGKGLRGKYWNFELECADSFDFDSMHIAMLPTARRL